MEASTRSSSRMPDCSCSSRVMAWRQEKLFAVVSAVLSSVQIHNTWSSTGALIYRNWLDHLCTQKGYGANQLPGLQIQLPYWTDLPEGRVTTRGGPLVGTL